MRAWGVATALVVVVRALTTGALTTGAGAAGSTLSSPCDWPMWGYGPSRTFATRCHSDIDAKSVQHLRLRWFFNTHDVVTATPALAHGSLYVGDWSGRVYALRAADGHRRWEFRAKVSPNVYSGQIVGSAAVAMVDGERTVFVPAGKTLYALRAEDGSVRWRHEIGTRNDPKDTTEIESSPVVVNGMVIFGFDVHNSRRGDPAGLLSLDARTGKTRWRVVTAPSTKGATPGTGPTGAGCGDVWGSPAVDRTRAIVVFGTGNCTEAARWGPFADAMVGVDLNDGTVLWSYQPHASNRDDLDFAGAPNLMTRAGRPVAGLGNKDGTYYLVDRETGEPVGNVQATTPGLTRPGGNFSTGGFIGPAAYSDGVVVGGTAVGPPPYLHGIDVTDLKLAWHSQEPSATYAASAITNDVAIVGGTDFTLRAIDVHTGVPLWSHPMKGAVSGGAVISRADVFAVAGIREPGLDQRSRTSGVYRFSLTGKRARIHIKIPKSDAPRSTDPNAAPQSCVGSPCAMSFDLKQPPPGTTPTAELEITQDPWTVRVNADGLGPPAAWLRAGTQAAAEGATRYAVFLSERDDNPTGGLICLLDAQLDCTTHRIPKRNATYNRLTIVAVRNADTIPTLADGFERLVTTSSFSPSLLPVK